MRKLTKRQGLVLWILCGLLVLASCACFFAHSSLAKLLPSQYAAERWAGEGDTAFRQVSCYLPVDETLSLNQIHGFRYAILDQLRGAAIEADTDTRLFRDAWSASGKLSASSDLGKGEVSVIAVGGDFFLFHPLRLLSGSYLTESDVMDDRVLLDEDTAWLLFGGTDLEGMPMKLNGVPFTVAGVVQREQDFASRKAYTAGQGVYMSFDAYTRLKEGAGASCYELVMTDPVKNFVLNFVKEKFPIGQGEIVENTGRFAFGKVLGLVREFGTRSMQKLGVVNPYWENAARCVEDWCSLMSFFAVLFLILPSLRLLQILIRLFRRVKRKLSEDVLPDVKDKTEEAIRRQQRRRWEKKHPGET